MEGGFKEKQCRLLIVLAEDATEDNAENCNMEHRV